ncbi:MAG: hypothetical protein MZV70_17810 [Desulfobacterales bacterium]|nr:hypothetical protein [Desulfobacterales bacterium]
MTPRETTDLTLAMAHSGQMLDLSDVVDLAVDKHSSGGVGDKTTIAVLPIVAACGLPVGKMSGRGLGFSGGTLDKLESIPGLSSGPHHRGIQKTAQGKRHCTHRSITRPGACGRQTVFPARCGRDGAVHSVDRLVHHVQETGGGGAGDRAGCEGRSWRLHGDPRRSPHTCRSDDGYRQTGGARSRGTALRHEPAARIRRRQCAGSGRGHRDPQGRRTRRTSGSIACTSVRICWSLGNAPRIWRKAARWRKSP